MILFFSIHTYWPKYFYNVIRNFKVPNWIIWHKELKFKKLFLFSASDTIPDDTLSFFSALWEKFLMSPKSPSSIFCYLATDGMLKNSKGSPLLARQGPAIGGPRRASSVPLWVFRVLWKKIPNALKSFCYFWAGAPTLTFPKFYSKIIFRRNYNWF